MMEEHRRMMVLKPQMCVFLCVMVLGWFGLTGCTRRGVVKQPVAKQAPRKHVAPRSQKIDPEKAKRLAKQLLRKQALSQIAPVLLSPFAHTVLLNGGGHEGINYYSHVLYLRMMRRVLRRRGVGESQITIFSSDGNDPGRDQTIARPSRRKLLRLLLQGRPEQSFLSPTLHRINTALRNKRLLPARRIYLEQFFGQLPQHLDRHRALRLVQKKRKGQAQNNAQPLKQRSGGAKSSNKAPSHEVLRSQALGNQAPSHKRPVFVFVTDHGQRNRRMKHTRNQFISLWNESLSVRQYHRLLRPLRKRRVVSVMSQCFSGSFFWSVFREAGRLSVPSGRRCGFFATLPDRPAYGCFPQTEKVEQVGHAYRFIKAMNGAKNLDEAHRRVLVSDQTPDVPLRSSDGYLLELLKEESKHRGLSMERLIDRSLARLGSRGYAEFTQDRKLLTSMAKRFSLPRPFNTKAVQAQRRQVRKNMRWWRKVSVMWKQTFEERRNGHLRAWYRSQPGLRLRLRRAFFRLRQTSTIEVRDRILASPDVQRLASGFVRYMQAKPLALQRLLELDRRHRLTEKHLFWSQVQLAVLLRMNLVLARMAGRLLLQHSGTNFFALHRVGFQRLQTCERTSLGQPLKQNVALLKTPLRPLRRSVRAILPSRLGILYRRYEERRQKGYPEGALQIREVYLRTAAANAGLRVGDVVLSVNGKGLRDHYDLRERVMLAAAGQPFVVRYARHGKIRSTRVSLQIMREPPRYDLPPLLGKDLASLAPLRALGSGAAIHDSSLRQQTKLLFFWATWCGPCKAALPTLRRWKARYASKGLDIIAVSREQPAKLRAWLQKHPGRVPFVQGYDPRGGLSLKLRISASPTLVLLHRGRVRLIKVGFVGYKTFERKMRAIAGF